MNIVKSWNIFRWMCFISHALRFATCICNFLVGSLPFCFSKANEEKITDKKLIANQNSQIKTFLKTKSRKIKTFRRSKYTVVNKNLARSKRPITTSRNNSISEDDPSVSDDQRIIDVHSSSCEFKFKLHKAKKVTLKLEFLTDDGCSRKEFDNLSSSAVVLAKDTIKNGHPEDGRDKAFSKGGFPKVGTFEDGCFVREDETSGKQVPKDHCIGVSIVLKPRKYQFEDSAHNEKCSNEEKVYQRPEVTKAVGNISNKAPSIKEMVEMFNPKEGPKPNEQTTENKAHKSADKNLDAESNSIKCAFSDKNDPWNAFEVDNNLKNIFLVDMRPEINVQANSKLKTDAINHDQKDKCIEADCLFNKSSDNIRSNSQHQIKPIHEDENINKTEQVTEIHNKEETTVECRQTEQTSVHIQIQEKAIVRDEYMKEITAAGQHPEKNPSKKEHSKCVVSACQEQETSVFRGKQGEKTGPGCGFSREYSELTLNFSSDSVTNIQSISEKTFDENILEEIPDIQSQNPCQNSNESSLKNKWRKRHFLKRNRTKPKCKQSKSPSEGSFLSIATCTAEHSKDALQVTGSRLDHLFPSTCPEFVAQGTLPEDSVDVGAREKDTSIKDKKPTDVDSENGCFEETAVIIKEIGSEIDLMPDGKIKPFQDVISSIKVEKTSSKLAEDESQLLGPPSTLSKPISQPPFKWSSSSSPFAWAYQNISRNLVQSDQQEFSTEPVQKTVAEMLPSSRQGISAMTKMKFNVRNSVVGKQTKYYKWSTDGEDDFSS